MKKIIKQEQWVMLPTEDDSPVKLTTKNNIIEYIGTMKEAYIGNDTNICQHLYLTSDDEIKEGDWYYDEHFEIIMKANSNSDHNVYNQSCKKIIATTDKSLMLNDTPVIGYLSGTIPYIPESFIKYYVEKQGEVGDVELEYTNGKLICLCKDVNHTHFGLKPSCENFTTDSETLKLTDNNEIIIDIPKEEEKMYSQSHLDLQVSQYSSYNVRAFANAIGIDVNVTTKWIEENLK